MLMYLSGQQIRELRKRLQLTMAEFAERVGVSAAAICLWEQEKRFPNHRLAVKLNGLWNEHPMNGDGQAKPNGKRVAAGSK